MFRASSVLLALERSSADIRGRQYAVCPLDNCVAAPAHCAKGLSKTCVKEVVVIYDHDNHHKVVNLRLYFTISRADHDGFIDEDNEFLRLLIRREVINENDLQRI